MTTMAFNRALAGFGLDSRLSMCFAPLAALVYPFVLKAFNAAVTAVGPAGRSPEAVVGAAVALALAFALPALTLVVALRFSQIEAPTVAQAVAKRIAIFAVAAPTMFVFIGVLLYMAGDPVPDTVVWIVAWGAIAVYTLLADNTRRVPTTTKSVSCAWRAAHGVSALLIVALFLGLHLSNHLMGLAGPEAHTAFMKIARQLYRAAWLEPVLVALFLFQVATGLSFAFRRMAAPMDPFRTFHVASGVFLAFYVLGHMDSVFIFARTYLGIDSGWGFATGAPTGLVKDPWNIRLVPHYALGVFFVLAHLAGGARLVLLSHGVRKEIADRVMIACATAGGVVATVIILAMCGMRLQFA